jgi:uncharacterized membrane protein/protein-disulfide isomerase
MSTTIRRWVLLFAAVGLAAATTSLYIHYRILAQPGYASPCDINATFSCSDAYRSQYGSLFGVPVALFGVLWFAFVIVLVAVASRGPAPVQESLPGYLFAWSTIGLAVTLYLGYAAFFVLREFCVFCLVTYAAVIALFCLTGVATSIPMTTLPRRALQDLRLLVTRPVALIVAVLFLAGAGSAIAFFPRAGQMPAEQPTATALPKDTRSDFEQYWAALPRQILPVSNDGAAVVIVKFTDYQCPSCSRTYFELQPILAKYQAELPGAVTLVSKDYPLDKSCNTALFQTIHPGGCTAAVAVRLAAQHHRAAQMEEWLYSNQQLLTPATVREAARTIGGVTDFDAQYQRTVEAVQSDIALGQLVKVQSTPTFFVNGIRVPENGLQPAYWDLAIRFELKRAGKLK